MALIVELVCSPTTCCGPRRAAIYADSPSALDEPGLPVRIEIVVGSP
jgi:hypothetical protein